MKKAPARQEPPPPARFGQKPTEAEPASESAPTARSSATGRYSESALSPPVALRVLHSVRWIVTERRRPLRSTTQCSLREPSVGCAVRSPVRTAVGAAAGCTADGALDALESLARCLERGVDCMHAAAEWQE